MEDSNYLRDRLRAAGAEQVSTCTLCAAIVNRRFQEAHHHDDQGDYEPLMVDDGGAVHTCKVCGILVNPSYEGAHDRVHQAEYKLFGPDTPGGGVDTCKLCGTLVDQYYQDAHDRTHA